MRRSLPLLSLLGLALLLAGCHEDPYLTVSPSNLSFPEEGGSQTIQVSANYAWTASVSGSGFKISPASGEGAGTVTVTAPAANSSDETTGSVSFQSEGLTAGVALKQSAKSIIQVGSVSMIPAEGGTFTVDVEYNTDLQVEVEESAQSWITFIQTKALKSGKLEFQFVENESEETRTGKVTVKDKSGKASPATITFTQQAPGKAAMARKQLMELYNALDGPNWKKHKNWGTDADIQTWEGVEFDEQSGVYSLKFKNFGLTGEIPEVIGKFTGLRSFVLYNEPGVTGTLPDTFSNLTNLDELWLQSTGLTSLIDVFSEMSQLTRAIVLNNDKMGGPLPESLGQLPKMNELMLVNNCFTGTIPSSWSHLRYDQFSVANNCLTGKIPQAFVDSKDAKYYLNYNLSQKEGYGFDISEIEIPGMHEFQRGPVIENLDGTTFTFDDVIHQNKYTVYVIWASWCNFSRVLMPQLRDYYEKYRQDGLEVIATSQVGGVDENGAGHLLADFAGYKQEIEEKGYDKWYNFYYPNYDNSYLTDTPNAEVYDSNGNVLFSSINNYPDPVRNRFGKIASSQLIPFLETLLGPAEEPDHYESKDYSKDGEVLTLQTASVGKGINLVFLGDAYTDKDMGENGLYEKVMKDAMEEYFAIEPYKTFRNRFNVYAVKAVSKNGRIGEGYSTAFSTRFGSGTYMEGDHEKCYEYAMKVPGIKDKKDLVICVMVNTLRHAGTAHMSRSLQSSVAYTPTYGNDREVFGSGIRHEAGGHGFAFLDDEYSTHNGNAPADYIADHAEAYDKYGWFANIDFTSDPEKVKWSAFISDSRYNGEIGVYEGASLYSIGVYRPSVNSMMRDNMEYYNAPSRWAIYQQIMKRSGETPSFDAFLEYDAVNRSVAAKVAETVRPPYKNAATRRFEPTAPPVILP